MVVKGGESEIKQKSQIMNEMFLFNIYIYTWVYFIENRNKSLLMNNDNFMNYILIIAVRV